MPSTGPPLRLAEDALSLETRFLQCPSLGEVGGVGKSLDSLGAGVVEQVGRQELLCFGADSPGLVARPQADCNCPTPRGLWAPPQALEPFDPAGDVVIPDADREGSAVLGEQSGLSEPATEIEGTAMSEPLKVAGPVRGEELGFEDAEVLLRDWPQDDSCHGFNLWFVDHV